MAQHTMPERLTKIETILERMEPKIDAIRRDLDADKAELAALKNKGAGVIVGVGLLGTLIGAKFSAVLHGVTSLFK